MFSLIENKELYFGNCEKCNAKCCNGKEGMIFSQIVLDDFENIYKYFPIVFIFGELNYIKAVVLITDGKNYCPYLKDFKCTIYDKRPQFCKTYPLSPNLDNKIYIDLTCPEVSEQKNGKTLLIKNNKLSKKFENEIFNTYQKRYLESHFEFEKLNKNNFKKVITINNLNFYSYEGELTLPYLKQHQSSLKNLHNFF